MKDFFYQLGKTILDFIIWWIRSTNAAMAKIGSMMPWKGYGY